MDIVDELQKIIDGNESYSILARTLEKAKHEIELVREKKEMWADATGKAADEIERLRKELADHLADVKTCSCKQRENDINQLFEELSK